MIIEVVMKPRGPLLFRTATPFPLGGYAETNIRPSEFTVAGMIRSAIMDLVNAKALSANPDTLQAIIGGCKGNTDYNFKWKLIGPYFYGGAEVYYPLPMDVLVLDQILQLPEWLIPQLIPLPTPTTKNFREILGPSAFEAEKAYKEYQLASSRFMEKYVKGECRFNADELVKIRGVVLESKIHAGIMLDRKTKTVMIEEGQGMYFAVEKIHMKEGWSFIAGLYIDDEEEKAEELGEVFTQLDGITVRLGGRSGMVDLEVREAKKLLEANIPAEKIGKGRLVITSSAIFKKNGKSFFLPPLNSVKGCVCKEAIIGGWDYAAGGPKPLHIGIRPGSVYYIDSKAPLSPKIIFEREFVDSEYRSILGSSLIAKGWCHIELEKQK